MFVRIGSGIFNSDDVRALLFDEATITVYLKNVKENEELEYSVEKLAGDISFIDKIVAALNAKQENVPPTI